MLCDPMGCSMPGLPVHNQLLELTQIHVHWVGDAIQPSHPLLSSSPPAFNLSQHQGLFKWVSSSHQVAKVLESQLQHQSFLNIQDWFPLGWTGWLSLQSKGLSMEYYSAINKRIWISSNDVDETGAYYTEWSKSEIKTPIQYCEAVTANAMTGSLN